MKTSASSTNGIPMPQILIEEARVVRHDRRPGDQGILMLHAPGIAARAQPGSFVHLRCNPLLPMRRPMSIMSAHDDGIEILYKITGLGTRLLSAVGEGTHLNLLGPIGRAFRPDPGRPRKILVGGGVGLPPVLFLAERLVHGGHDPSTITLLYGSELPFPLEFHDEGTASVELARAHTLAVTSRLASRTHARRGIHAGYVTDLLKTRLESLSASERGTTEVAACGPGPMLAEVQRLCRHYSIRGELCLEELMACAVGGCGGCTVAVRDPQGIAMKRVCVDGPVFDTETLVFDA